MSLTRSDLMARPRRETHLPFARPSIGQEEIDEAADALRSGWITTGPKTAQLEQEFAAYVGAGRAIALNSGTAALHLALEAAGVGPGDEVITTTYTFAATAEVVLYLRGRPVFVDCRPDTLNLDHEQLADKITDKTRAVIPVHLCGQPCEMDAIIELCRPRGICVIEDAAHAVPAKYHGQMVGRIGDMTCFSFYANKNMTTGEGGMVTTDNDAWADRIKMMSLHGLSRDAWRRYQEGGSWHYDIAWPGHKYNISDILSAVGIHQLRKLDGLYRRRRELVALYQQVLDGLDGVVVPTELPDRQHAWHLFIVRVDFDSLRITRAELMQALADERIGAAVHYLPLHMAQYYRETFGYQPDDFPQAHALYRQAVSLPLFPAMSDDDVLDAAAALWRIVESAR